MRLVKAKVEPRTCEDRKLQNHRRNVSIATRFFMSGEGRVLIQNNVQLQKMQSKLR